MAMNFGDGKGAGVGGCGGSRPPPFSNPFVPRGFRAAGGSVGGCRSCGGGCAIGACWRRFGSAWGGVSGYGGCGGGWGGGYYPWWPPAPYYGYGYGYGGLPGNCGTGGCGGGLGWY